MTFDAFELLHEEKRPWLDVEGLKSRFRTLSSEFHPDRFHSESPEAREAAGQRYAALNQAHQTLVDPKERLLHLLTLERGAPPKDIQRIPQGTMDLFVEIGQSCRDADAFLALSAAGLSPLVKVQRLRDARVWVQKFQALQAQVNLKQEQWVKAIQELDSQWPSPSVTVGTVEPKNLDRLEEIYRGLSYIARWQGQLQQRIVELLSVG